MSARGLAIVAAIVALAPRAHADPSSALRDGNDAATRGDWPRVEALVVPLFAAQPPLAKPELAEAYRLAGLAAYFQQRPADAEQAFLGYLRLELDGQLDPSIYPPEVVSFFANVRETHKAELRALRPKPRGSIWLSLLPPIGQLQNGERTKAIVLGSVLGASAIANVGSYALMSSWCTRVSGTGGSSLTCDGHAGSAGALRTVNLASGIVLIASYVYGVYDGVTGYRRRTREVQWTPYTSGNVVGVFGAF